MSRLTCFSLQATLRRAAVLLICAGAGLGGVAQAQDYFIPGQQKPAAGPAPARPAPRPPAPPAPRPQALPQAQPLAALPPGEPEAALPTPSLPPPPDLQKLPHSTTPPSAVVGVLGVPEVMRASTAAQMVDRVVGERRDRLNQEAQKEQAVWREMQQQLATQRSLMSPEQADAKDRELRDRITNAQKQFRDHSRIVQEAAQYGVAQIERTLVAVIRQVAESHGMNLVLHRSQVALNVADFDITDEVAAQLNKVLPSVIIPPDGVEPPTLASPQAGPVAGPIASGPVAAGPVPVSAAPANAPAAGPRP